MYLTEWDQEKLFIYVIAKLAEERKAKGMKLNYPEAVAVITFKITEEARTGKYTVSDLQRMAHHILTEDDVMDGVPALLTLINVQVTMPDGNKLVVVNQPFLPAEHPEWGELPPNWPNSASEGGDGKNQQHGNRHQDRPHRTKHHVGD